MFFIATEEKLVLCRPFDKIISWLPCLAALQRQCADSLSRFWFCAHAPLLATLLQTFYRVLTDNMAKNKLTDAEIRNILEQMDAENILK